MKAKPQDETDQAFRYGRLTGRGASAMLHRDTDSESLLIRSREAGKVARLRPKDETAGTTTRGDAGFFLSAVGREPSLFGRRPFLGGRQASRARRRRG